jgi:predicted MFS family arabinose efflux permease
METEMRRATAARTYRATHVRPWRATLAGLCATLVGIGLARFAYTPLIPALIEAGWFTSVQVAYLGAANLAGYLAGALLAGPTAARVSPATLLRAMMALATASFLACVAPHSFSWFFTWRFASGLAGGALMVLAAPTVLPRLPSSRRGVAGGAIFTGVGLGIAASGTLVPLLLDVGLSETWIGLGVLALALTIIAWGGWPEGREGPTRKPPRPSTLLPPAHLALRFLYLQYGLNAVGLVPHMIFLVDFVARGLGRGLDAGAWYWVLFGVGAMAGPVVAGYIADRIGFSPALRLAFVSQAACVGWLAVSDGVIPLVVSSVVIGAYVPGIVPLVLGRVNELIPDRPREQRAAWARATTAFAIGQASAAFALAYLFERTASYTLLFVMGFTALLLALAVDLPMVISRRTEHR